MPFSSKVLITLAGMPATREFGGTMVPLVTTAPAATIEPWPITSTVKHGGMHTDEAVVLNSAGMQQSAVAYGYIIANDAGVFVGNVQYAVVLDVAVTANLDAVNVAADSNTGPNAGVLFKLNLANQGGSIKGIGLFINFGGLCFKFKNHGITAFCKLAAFAAVLKDKQFLLTLLLSYEQIIKSRRSHLFCRCEGLFLTVEQGG